MSVKELSTSQKSTTLLLAGYVAIESYFLSLILGAIIGRFWFSGAILNTLSVFAAYLIASTIMKRTNDSRRKKIVMAIVVLAFTLVAAITASAITLYLQKLQLQSTFN
jgi:FtsH-binding integral membrane protein